MTKLKMQPKGGKSGGAPRQAMPAQKWSTLAAGLELVVVDNQGQPIPNFDPSKVTSTLTFDPPDLVSIAPGADAVSYTATRAAGSTGNGTFTATVTYLDGSAGPFNSTLPIELDGPPPPQPTDLQIRIVAA